MPFDNRETKIVAFGAVIGALAAGVLAHVWRPEVCDRHLKAAASKRPKTASANIHVLTVDLTFEKTEDRTAFGEWWAGLAETVYNNEPNCLSYELLHDNENDCRALIFERYTQKADLDGPHQETLSQFTKEHPSLGLKSTKTLTHYTETGIGHMDR